MSAHGIKGMHWFRFTYYERYEELMKEGRSESNARAEATAAAETAVKNAVLPYKARRPRQLEGWERCCALRCYRAPYDSKRSPTRPFDTWRGSVRAPVPRDAEPCPTLLLEWLRDLVEMHALFSCVSRGHHGVVWVLGVLKYSVGSTTAVSRPRNAVGCMTLSACGKGDLVLGGGPHGPMCPSALRAQVSPVVQLQPPVAASVATATLVQGAPSAPESIAQAAGPLAKR